MRYCVFHGLSRPFCWWYITKTFSRGCKASIHSPLCCRF
nr:MAG TPA_asm: hypothetical protein [Caudoviricetes sp.]